MKTPKNASRSVAAVSAPQVNAGAPLDDEILTPGAAPGSSPADGTTAGTKSEAHSSQAATDHPAPEEQGSGTNTPASEGGDAAGEALAELVKPLNNVEPTAAILAAAAPDQSSPKTEASVFGRFNFTPEELERIASGMDTPEAIIRAELADLAFDKVDAAISSRITSDEGDKVTIGFDLARHRDVSSWSVARSDEQEFRQKHPLTAAAFDAWTETDSGSVPILRVTAKRAGFWRAGVSHPAEAVEHDIRYFTAAQVEAILAEPMLVSEII